MELKLSTELEEGCRIVHTKFQLSSCDDEVFKIFFLGTIF